ncbi:hypothetical protein PABG_05051 [Paracoccidioides brasiliensis Pb03]|nr:hypothetical protein PABG_05051 [Paracoccidioides brasiliensis Pb03]
MAADLKLFRQYLNIDRFPALLVHWHVSYLESMRACNRKVALCKLMIVGIEAVTAKTLIIFGGQYCRCTSGTAEQTRNLGLNQATVVVLDQCDPFSWLEKPDAMFTVLKKFLAACWEAE